MTSLVVTAAVIERDGRVLVTRRLKGTHLEGYWEFPGGKCEPGEALDACLQRELREELGVNSVIGEEILATRHAYPDKQIVLHFFSAVVIGEPVARLGQEMQWIPLDQLDRLRLPPADDELVALLTRRHR